MGGAWQPERFLYDGFQTAPWS